MAMRTAARHCAVRVALVSALVAAVALTGCLKGTPFDAGVGDPGPADYVSSRDYTRWIIELDIVRGMDPPSSALTVLHDRLAEVVSKPDGIEVRKDETLDPRGGVWTQEDVLATSERTQDVGTGDGTVSIHVLVLDGEYQTANVLGATYHRERSDGTVTSSGPIVLFAETIRDAACPPPLGLCLNEEAIWQAVFVHEFGHAMGLVNIGAPMQTDHEDDAHPGHSDNRNSVMYYAVETLDVITVFQGGPPTTFDDDDRADLCALGGKC